jgi:hypothetical protein
MDNHMSSLTKYWQLWPTDRMINAAKISLQEGKDRGEHQRIMALFGDLKTIFMNRERDAVVRAQRAALEEARSILAGAEDRIDAMEKLGALIDQGEII